MTPAPSCDRCGYAVGVRRVMLMVEGRAMNDHRLCQGCLSKVFDALQSRVAK